MGQAIARGRNIEVEGHEVPQMVRDMLAVSGFVEVDKRGTIWRGNAPIVYTACWSEGMCQLFWAKLKTHLMHPIMFCPTKNSRNELLGDFNCTGQMSRHTLLLLLSQHTGRTAICCHCANQRQKIVRPLLRGRNQLVSYASAGSRSRAHCLRSVLTTGASDSIHTPLLQALHGRGCGPGRDCCR